MESTSIILKPGKEKAIKNKHHWIFSGAIAKAPQQGMGDIFPVYSSQGERLGSAYYNSSAKIVARMIAFGEANPMETIRNHVKSAGELRKILFNHKETNSYRLINAEGDFLPGLIVDKYDDLLVMQISTLGMERLRLQLIEMLKEFFQPKAIYEKSIMPARKEECLQDTHGWIFGNAYDPIKILENGHRFIVSVSEGQKTGFFLDHREMRKEIGKLSKGRRVLNCFSYSGGFSVYAAAGGAESVDSVDISAPAMDLARQNMELNSFSKGNYFTADVFQFLRQNPLNYDIIILDPPAFAKKQKDIIQGCRGYKDINRVALQKMPPRSLLLTCSCSYFVDEALFQKVIFQAAVEANRKVRIIGKHHMASDHCINVCHPESDYLKSLLLYIE